MAKAREGCIYRVFTPLCIRASNQFIPGSQERPVIADLSDVDDAMLKWLLNGGLIETADGEPINKATGAVSRPPCPCSEKKE
jgi:hypothetical protein